VYSTPQLSPRESSAYFVEQNPYEPLTAFLRFPASPKRAISEPELRSLFQIRTIARQFGLLGELRVTVLQLNFVLD